MKSAKHKNIDMCTDTNIWVQVHYKTEQSLSVLLIN